MKRGRILASVAILLSIALMLMPFVQVDAAGSKPSLGSAASFAVLGVSMVTSTGNTYIVGDLGVSPGTTVTGFYPSGSGSVTGNIHAGDPQAASAETDAAAAYNFLSQTCEFGTSFGTTADLGGETLAPGVYCYSDATVTGTLTLDAGGNPNAVWIFRVDKLFQPAANSLIILANGGSPCNVFWQANVQAGSYSQLVGTIISTGGIYLGEGTNLLGRALDWTPILPPTGVVSMNANTIDASMCPEPETTTETTTTTSLITTFSTSVTVTLPCTTCATTSTVTVTQTETTESTTTTPTSWKSLNLPSGSVQATPTVIPGSVHLSGVPFGYSVHDGTWQAWCADKDAYINSGQVYSATLYSSYDPGLPSWAKTGKQWDMINYILNHKNGASYADVQAAVWYFTGQPMPPTPGAQALVNNALAHGSGFHPSHGQIEAVVLIINCQVQTVFIEVDP